MVNKRKNIKRKLRMLKQLKRRNEVEHTHNNTGSKGDALISSMEALIRKISMAPSAPPSTIVSNAPVPQSNVRTEVTKEDIANEIARQREVDMLRNQVHYMYDQINEDLKARRSKGETMANMQARGTDVKPKDFGIDENDVTYRAQKDAAKSKHQLFTLTQHEILDQKEITRKERAVLHDTLSQTLINKLQNIGTTPRVDQRPKLSSSSFVITDNPENNPKRTLSSSSAFTMIDEPEQVEIKPKTKLSTAVFSTINVERGDVDTHDIGLGNTPRSYRNTGIETSQSISKPVKTPTHLSKYFDTPNTPPSSKGMNMLKESLRTSRRFHYTPGTPPKQSYWSDEHNDSIQASPPPTADKLDIMKRTAEEFAEQSFEEVTDTVKKLAVQQKIEDAVQQRYDQQREDMMQKYNKLSDTNNKIVSRINEIIESYTSLSPERNLEKALKNKFNRKTLEDQIDKLEKDIFKKKHDITMAEHTLKTTRGLAPSKIREYEARIANTKELVQQMTKTLESDRKDLANSSDVNIGRLQNERKLKMRDLSNRIKEEIQKDPELNDLIKESNNLQFMIKTDNNFNDISINIDPYGAKEALRNVNQLAEQRVRELNDELNEE